MPPRRSCFARPGRPGEILRKFQCHHGVPASEAHAAGRSGPDPFQCHHGVPASCPRGGGGSKSRRFNATTAFLLPVLLVMLPFLVLVFQCHHGVPASGPVLEGGSLRGRFQCHHGVPASGRTIFGVGCFVTVSMPPRRSCFQQCHQAPYQTS